MNYMIMNALELEVLLYYYYTQADIENRSGPQTEAVIRLKELGLVASGDTGWNVTPRGKAHVEAILSLPLPVQIWVTPNEKTST